MVAGDGEVVRRIGAGGGSVPRLQTECRRASTLLPPSRGALRVRVFPACGCRPTGPSESAKAYTAPHAPHSNRLRTTGASPDLTAQKRDGPPHHSPPPRGTQAAYGPRQGPRQGRGRAGRRCTARLSRHTGPFWVVRLFGPAGGCVTPTLRKPPGQVLARSAVSSLHGERACRGASFAQAVRERQALLGQGCVATARAQSAAGPHVIGGREAPLEAKIRVGMRPLIARARIQFHWLLSSHPTLRVTG